MTLFGLQTDKQIEMRIELHNNSHLYIIFLHAINLQLHVSFSQKFAHTSVQLQAVLFNSDQGLHIITG